MGIIKDKLNEQWELMVQEALEIQALRLSRSDLLAVRDAVEKLYKDLKSCLETGGEHYPTGIIEFDNYISPIVSDISALKIKLENNYGEFLNWRKP